MDISIDGVWRDLLVGGIILLVAYLIVLWIASVVWVYRDATARTRDPMLRGVAVLLVVTLSFAGLIVYLVMRPRETLVDQYERRLEAEALMHEIQEQATCPMCRRKIEADFVVCPFCRSALRIPCESCGRALITTWVLCPYCGADRPSEEPAPKPVAIRAHTAAADEGAGGSRGRARRPSTATYTPPAAARAAQAPNAPAADPAAESTP